MEPKDSSILYYNILQLEGSIELLDKVSRLIFDKHGNFIFTIISPIPIYVTNEWYLKNWGTLHRTYQSAKIRTPYKLSISFITIDFPPLAWINKLYEKFPELYCKLGYFTEKQAMHGYLSIGNKPSTQHIMKANL